MKNGTGAVGLVEIRDLATLKTRIRFPEGNFLKNTVTPPKSSLEYPYQAVDSFSNGILDLVVSVVSSAARSTLEDITVVVTVYGCRLRSMIPASICATISITQAEQLIMVCQ